MRRLDAAEQLLQSLGITEPREIDLEAIAYDQGAKVKYCRLHGCEADILGYKNKAIISIDSTRSKERKRFSLAHELGHWHFHRGKRLQCRVDEFQPKHRQWAERQANEYAASLMMPRYLIQPISRDFKKLTFEAITQISQEFETSVTATAIRLVELDIWPCMLVCHTESGRKWFTQAKMFATRWFPQELLDSQSSAFDVMFGSSAGDKNRRLTGADAWFDRSEAQRYEMYEQATKIGNDEILALLTIKDERMLEL